MFRYLLVSIPFLFQIAHAETNCFDFSKTSTHLLKTAPTKFVAGTDPSDSGTDAKENDWGSVSGVVNKPIAELYQKLLDPKTIRNGDNTKVEVVPTDTKDFLKKFIEKIVIKPVFFVTINWSEEWGFALKDGTAEKPHSIVISYQKVEGTSHIKHLCGNILLESLTPASTGVFLYEEVQADRRSSTDVLNGITGTLRTLRD
jgi:hypothetical protein